MRGVQGTDHREANRPRDVLGTELVESQVKAYNCISLAYHPFVYLKRAASNCLKLGVINKRITTCFIQIIKLDILRTLL